MREYNELYKSFRDNVLRRDGYKCKFPNCNRTSKLQVHHIAKYSLHPDLELDPNNGITLCKSCHWKIYGKEEQYEPLFRQIICGPTITLLLRIQKGLQ